MEEEKKTKWKCRSCEKILASKQNALKHVQKFHEEKSPTETIVKVKVTNVEKQPKPVPKVKKKAYAFCSQLHSIFNDANLVEKFSWSKRKKSNNSEQVSAGCSSQGPVANTRTDGLSNSSCSDYPRLSSSEPTTTLTQSIHQTPITEAMPQPSGAADMTGRTIVMTTSGPEQLQSMQVTNSVLPAMVTSPTTLAPEHQSKNPTTTTSPVNDSLSSTHAWLCSKTIPSVQNAAESPPAISNSSYSEAHSDFNSDPDLSAAVYSRQLGIQPSIDLISDPSVGQLDSRERVNVSSESDFNGIEVGSIDVSDISDIDFTSENETFNMLFFNQDTTNLNNATQHFMIARTDNQARQLPSQNSTTVASEITDQILPIISAQYPAPFSPTLASDGSVSSHTTGLPGANPQHTFASMSPQSTANPSTSAGQACFKVPYKRVRGHCGNQECEGCNREPCETCYNCLHKKEKR